MSRGSVKRSGQGWKFVIDVGVDPVTGKRRQVQRRGFPTRKAAQAALTAVTAELHGEGRYMRPTKGTTAEYLTSWLDSRQADLRPTTLYGYRKVVTKRIIPGIGDTKLAELDAAYLEAWYGRLLVGGGRDGARLSSKTVANTAGIVSIALGDAVRLKLIRHNPATEARLPRREHREMTAWSEDETAAFLAAVADDRLYPLWLLVLMTGLRRGELCGLRWRDLDLAAGTLEVVQSRVVAEEVVTGAPKTKAGFRRLALEGDTVTALAAWRKRQLEERLAAGSAWTDHGLVFVDELGGPPHPETVTRWWREAIEAAGARPIRLHDARHTMATLSLRLGVRPKVLAQRLGHADVTVTMRVYEHVTAEDDRIAADALGEALRSRSVTNP